MHNNKTAIYTAIFSDDGCYQHDSLKEDMDFDQDNVDFICFTNNRYIVSDNWDVRYVDDLVDGSGRKTARYHKIMVHEILPEYKDWIWMDGSHKMTKSLDDFYNEFVEDYSESTPPENALEEPEPRIHDIVAAPHPDRNCIYDEGEVCKNRGLDDPDVIDKQMSKYKDEGYPKDNGLIESSVLYRFNSDLITIFNEIWWEELNNHSVRDQLSFNYAVWRMQDDYIFDYQLMDGCICLQRPTLNYGKSQYFQSSPHIKKQWPNLRKIFRISDAGYDKDKLPISEIECLRNFVEVFGTTDLYVLADKCSDETKAELDKIDNLYWKEIEGGSSAGSWREARDFAINKFEDDDIIYFIEDDYIHLEKSSRILFEGISEGSAYVTLYDHPDKYLNASQGGNPHVKNGGEVTRVFTSEHSHWKLTNSTTMTFACKLKTLKEDADIWKKHTNGTHPNDYKAFMELRENGRSLASPIPGYSTHIESKWLTPFRNWEEFINE